MKQQKTYYQPLMIGFFALIVLSFPTWSTAQVELSLSPGYMFSGRISGNSGRIDIKDHGDWTAAMNYRLGRRYTIEFAYTTQKADVLIEEFGRHDRQENLDLRIEYFMLSFLKEPFASGERIRPFGGFSTGLVAYTPQEEGYNSIHRLALGLNGGVRVGITEKLGFRLAGRLLFPVTVDGAALWCGTGGCDIGASSTAYMAQGDLQAGLYYQF
ncbi:MAG: hypothetical protein R2824_10115 [Saprospiraceae bacterium]|nr:hypothetical protein [Lewinella sp.]